MKQNSKEWLKWRKEGIGSSDAPAVMGLSPYTTPYELFREKTGKGVYEKKANAYILELGHELEKKMRAMVELVTGYTFKPVVCQHPERPYIRASLDGYDEKFNIILECKMVGRSAYQEIMHTNRPLLHHLPQLWHQFAVTGATRIIYAFCTNERNKMLQFHYLEIYPDANEINKLMEEEAKFWAKVQSGEWGDLGKKDSAAIENPELFALLKQYKMVQSCLKDLEKSEKELKVKISELLTHPNMHSENCEIKTRVKKGGISYKKALDSVKGETDLDLEKFRTKDSSYITIKFKEGQHDGE